MTWRQSFYIWAYAIFDALSGLIARGIRMVNKVFKAGRPAIDLPTYSRSSSFIQECDHGDGISIPWAMFDPAMAKCGSRMSRHSTRHGTRRPIIPSAGTKASLLSWDEYFPMRGLNALHGAGSSRTVPSGHNTMISLSSSTTSPSVTTPLFLSTNIPICLPGVVSASDPKLTGGVGKVSYANADDHGLPLYSKRRKVPRLSSVADLTSSAMVNVSDSPQGIANSNLPDEEDRIARVRNSVLQPSDLCHGSPDGFDLSHLASVTAASRRRRKAYQPNLFSAANVVGSYYLTPVLPVPSCRAPYLRSSKIRLLAPEAEGPRHSASVEGFETLERVSTDWDEASVCDCSLEEDHGVCSVSESKTGIIDNIQASRTSWVEFLDSGSISPTLGTHHTVDGGAHGIFSIESTKRYRVVNSDAEPPCPPPRKAVTTGNSRRHIRIYGNLLEQQDEDTPAVYLEQDYGFKALPDILEQESGLLPDCTRHSGLRALILPNLVARRISAGSNLPLHSPEPLDSSSIVSASPEMDVFERSGDVVPVLRSGGLESLRALIAALESVSPESQFSNMGLSPSMSSPTSDFSPWDEDSVGEANVSWGIAT